MARKPSRSQLARWPKATSCLEARRKAIDKLIAAMTSWPPAAASQPSFAAIAASRLASGADASVIMPAYHLPSIEKIAEALGCDVTNGEALVPGPGHTAEDRSLAIKCDSAAPDGFVVHSFAGDDPIVCRDYIREKCGQAPWKPKGNANGHARRSEDEVEAALATAIKRQSADSKSRVVCAYPYSDEGGTLLYEVIRLEPKSFRQRRPD